MKRITLFSLMAAFVAALSFTSCNTDGDSYTALTPEQQYQCQSSMEGFHSGKLYFSHKNEADVKNQTDSVDIAWYNHASDSSMTISQFPISKLAEHVTYEPLQEVIAQSPNQELNFKVVTYKTEGNYLYNQVFPMTITMENVEYDGEKHKVQWVFYMDYYSITGVFDFSKKIMQNQFYLYGIWIDDKQTDYLKNSVSTNGQQTNIVPFLMVTK